MKKENKGGNSETHATELRKQAEKIARKTDSLENIEMMSPEERRMLLHELRVHQVELEMQNEELRRTETELNAQRERYFDLYDMAPVGYMTVSKQGLILEANLTAATLLGVAKSALSKALLTRFIIKEDQDIYYRHRKELFETHSAGSGQAGKPQTFELRMVKKDETYFWAHLEAIAVQNPSTSLLQQSSVQAGQADGTTVCRIVLNDITQRKLAEEMLRENKAQLKEAHRLAHIGIWNWVAETDTVTWSEELYSIAGIDPSKPAPSYAEQSKIYAPESWKLLKEAVDEVLKTGRPYQLELELVRPDGTVRWVNAFGGSAYDSNGCKTGLHGTLQDIAERKLNEEELQQNEKRLRKLVDILQHPSENIQDFLDYALDQAIELTNSKIGYIYHYHEDRQEFVLNTWSKEVMAECTVANQQTCYELDKTGIWGEAVRQRKPILINNFPEAHPLKKGYPEGHAKLFKFLTVPIFKGESIVGVVGLANKATDYNETDILQVSLLMEAIWKVTESKRAENQLRESEDKYKKAFHTNQDAININRLTDGMYILVNEGFTKLTGYTDADIAGKTSVEINIWENKTDRDRLVEGLKRDGKVENLEANFRKQDGAIIRGLMSATAINIDGISHIFSVTRDITDRKRAEEEKQNLEERLSRAEKMESLGLLAGGVAHDLNNVLGIVVGYAELLLDSVDEKSPLRKDLTTIFDGGQKAAAIVEDLLTLARRGVVGKKVLNINKLIADFKKSPQWSKLLTYHPSVQIKTDLDPDLLNISASSIHLEKTLYNLISNAGEAMTSGGNINIKTSNQYIDKPISGYDTIHEGDYVVLSVSDEGDGISESDLKRIFEPFYTKKIMGRSGTGLGLSVVWGTVKDHQGYIDVQSEEGRGTTFTLYFLITREDTVDEDITVSISEYLGNGESILIVDDVKDQRDLAARLLTSLNYKVSSVSSGEEAIQYLKENKVDLLVLDMIMDPGMDGLDTYKSVREINPKQKAIIVSGFSESDRVKEAKTLGAGAYIKKPYIKEKLGLAVKKELGNER